MLSREAWASYFALFPDYRIHVDRIFSRGGSVAIFGTARGSYHGRGRRSSQSAWRIRAAWLAIVRAGKIAEWRVYADIEPMRKSAGLDRS